MSKIKLHFNRINMQRKNPRVWSAHTSKSCNPSEKVIIMHNGVKILETVFNPDANQPRAYMSINGSIETNSYGETVINVD